MCRYHNKPQLFTQHANTADHVTTCNKYMTYLNMSLCDTILNVICSSFDIMHLAQPPFPCHGGGHAAGTSHPNHRAFSKQLSRLPFIRQYCHMLQNTLQSRPLAFSEGDRASCTAAAISSVDRAETAAQRAICELAITTHCCLQGMCVRGQAWHILHAR